MPRYVFDIETNGLLDTLDRVHCLVLKDLDTGDMYSCAAADALPHSIEYGLRKLQDADYICGHNILGFDLPALQKVYPWFQPRGVVRDTMLEAKLVWPKDRLREKDFRLHKAGVLPGHLIGAYKLEAFGHRLKLHKGDYAAQMKARGLDPWAEWRPEMQAYCEQDVLVTEALRRRIDAEAQPEAAVEAEHRVAQIIRRQERYGFAFDKDAAVKLYAELVQRAEDLKVPLMDAFAPWYRPAGVHTPKRTVNYKAQPGVVEGCPYTRIKLVHFNPDSRDHIADRLMKVRGWQPAEFTPEGRPKVDEKILGQLPYPEAKAIAEYLMVEKRLGQLATGKEAWLDAVGPDGRIHGRVDTCGTVTFRMAHSGPNMGQVPSLKSQYGKECRSLFIAGPGKVLVGCDADALELRCLGGYMARYDGGAYIRVILEGDKAAGTDMHSVNARALGLDPKKVYPIDGKPITGRDIAKVWFYAFIYGAGDYKLGTILGVRDREKAVRRGRASRQAFLTNLPALGKLVEAVQRKAKMEGVILGLDKRRIYVRHQHAALNTLLQSAGAIFMKYALIFLDDDLHAAGYSDGLDYEFVANVHDEWQIECNPEIAEEVGRIAKQAIVKAGEHFRFPCPLDGAYSVGRNWAETH